MSTENNNQTNDSEWRQREMGALWKKTGRNQTFLSGQIKLKTSDGAEELVRIIVFNNKNKKSDNAPDFVIYKSEDRREQSSEQSAAAETSTVEADGNLL